MGKWEKYGKSMGTWWCYTREWYEMHWATMMGKWRAELSTYGWAWDLGVRRFHTNVFKRKGLVNTDWKRVLVQFFKALT
jgi:hypothetical protein